jgi:hypothetical protein
LGLNPGKSKSWPNASNWLWKRMREILPLLETHEIRIFQDHEGSDNCKRRVIVLDKMVGPGKYRVSKDGIRVSSGPVKDENTDPEKLDTYAESVAGSVAGQQGQHFSANVGVTSSNEFGNNRGERHEHGVPLHHVKNAGPTVPTDPPRNTSAVSTTHDTGRPDGDVWERFFSLSDEERDAEIDATAKACEAELKGNNEAPTIVADKILKQLTLDQTFRGTTDPFDAVILRQGLRDGRHGKFGNYNEATIKAAIRVLLARGEIYKGCDDSEIVDGKRVSRHSYALNTTCPVKYSAVSAMRNEIAAEQAYDDAASTFELHVTAPDYITCDVCGHKDHDVRVSPDGIARETCLNCGDSCNTVYDEATVRLLRKLYGGSSDAIG